MEDKLLIRFLSRQCSPEDEKEISEWIRSDKANAEWLFEIERIWSLKDELHFSDQKEIEAAFHQFKINQQPAEAAEQDETFEGKVSSMFSGWVKYAAAAIIIALLSVNVYDIVKDRPIATNTIEVPKGHRVAITLSDGTKAWLNSDSRLTYPSEFSKRDRSITLDGEAYFEVTTDPGRPFIINSSDLKVKVLGTKFNMKAYKNEGSSVILKEGKVEVSAKSQDKAIILYPNQQINYSKQDGLQLVNNADVQSAESWLKGELSFVGEPLLNIVKSLERKFDTPIFIADESLKQELFTCRVQQDASLKQILNLLESTRKLNYSMEKEKIIITKIK